MENAPIGLRGELTRWLLEIKAGVFVGNISASVRDKLWEKVLGKEDDTSALMLFSAKNEQGFDIKMSGEPHRSVIDIDGLKLIKVLV